MTLRVSYWPDTAWRSVVGSPWPWIAPDAESTYARRVRPAVEGFWERRLEHVPDTLLSRRSHERLRLVRSSINAQTGGGAGFEKVAACVDGSPGAFWFFDLGCAAWILALGDLRAKGLMPSEPRGVNLASVETLWAKSPATAIAALDPVIDAEPTAHPALCLYRAPLALWHERDAVRAMTLLDRAAAQMSPDAARVLGITLPLTYALLHAMSGNTGKAAETLAPGRGRSAGWTGLGSPEVLYHRARYLWDGGKVDEAVDALETSLSADASYALRMSAEQSWRSIRPTAHPRLGTMLAEVVRRARDRVTDWQQGRVGASEQSPYAEHIDNLFEMVGDESYTVLAASTMVPAALAWERARAGPDRAFHAGVQRLREFANGIPSRFPLRIGPSFESQFAGEVHSDMSRLDRLLEHGPLVEARDHVDALHRAVGPAVRMALASYLTRVGDAITTSVEVMAKQNRDANARRIENLMGLANDCLGAVDPIRRLGGEVTPGMLDQMRAAWDVIEGIERRWIASDLRAHGQLAIRTPQSPRPIARGDWLAYACDVVDVEGTTVPGVPVVWRVLSGPAEPKNPSECLYREWAISMESGTYLPIRCGARGRGDEGVLEAAVLGSKVLTRLPYRVEG